MITAHNEQQLTRESRAALIRPIVFSIVPKERIFFELFEKTAANVHRGMERLLELMGHSQDIPTGARKIKDIEHEGDRLTHEMLERLNKTFVTPMDRDDIHELACRLDGILDFVAEAFRSRWLGSRIPPQ